MAVQVRIEDLHHPEGGHAQIVFTGIGRTASDWLVIRRFEHQENYLSPEGWRGPETHIAPLGVADVPGGIALTLGPEITGWVEYGERIEVALARTAYRGIAMWPEIGGWVGERRRSGRTVIASRGRAVGPRPATQPPLQPTAPPDDQVTVIGQRTVLFPQPPPTVAPPPFPPPAPPPSSAVGAAAAGRMSARRRNTWIAAGVLLLVLAAGGGYYGYTEWWPGAPGTATPPVPDPTTADPTPPTSPPGNPPGQVDLATLVNRPPEEVFRMAEQLYAQGSYAVAFTLFDDASRRGFGPAHTRIAGFYDPATFEQDKPFQRPNPRKALEHYEQAIAAGDTSARGPRDALIERVRATARGNDRAARDAQSLLRDLRL